MDRSSKTVNCVKGEIYNMLAIMRFVPNFSATPDLVKFMQYIAEFKELFENLLVCSDIDSVDFWTPFLKIIQAGDVSGPITGVALSSIHKFLLYEFLSSRSGFTLNNIVNSVVQCNFHKNFSSSDEVVLMKLLHVFLECLRSPASVYLTDGSAWSMIKKCFDVFEKEPITELLKKTTQNTLLQMFLIIFRRIEEMNKESEGYGAPCLKHILLHLASFIGCSEREDGNWKEKRCLGLFLLNTALETAGESIGIHEKVVNVIQDNICKALLVNSTTDDLFILSLTLRVVFNLFQSVKRHLKVQLEVFFNSIHLKIAGQFEDHQESTMYQRSELALESLVDFCREPSLILELFTNYDCDVHFANLFEALAKFLCKHAFPLNGKLHRLNELCLEGLLAILSSFAMRCNQIHHEIRTKPNFREKKKEKEKVIQGAEIFNSSPKHFIPKLLEAGIIHNSEANTIAAFFKDNPAIDLDLLGEYLGANKDFNKEVLYQFIMLFDLEKLRIDEAIKLVLSSFHMPGEAQIIERILEAFSKAYYRSDSIYANQDAVYVLGYSVIMLNTVLHNVNVKVKMSEEEFIRNNRGINDGANFPSDMLSDIYKSIKNDPIQVLDIVHSVDHEELINPELANSKWGKILKRTEFMGDYSMLNELLLQPAGDHEKDMFDILWEAGLLNTLTNALEMASDARVLDQIKELFMQISKIATYYSMTEHISKIISNLSQVFMRSSESFVVFYSSPRAVGALESAVAATMICKDHLRGSWGSLINCLLRLHSLQLLPSQLVELDDFLDSEGRILPPGNSEEIEEWKMNYFKTQGRSSSTTSLDEEIHLSHDLESGSIWNSFTKYLGVQEPKKKKEDMMLEMRTELKVKVTGTGIQILFLNTKALGVESLNYLIKTLISRIKDAAEEIHTVLCLELFTNAIISNHNRLTEPIWQLVLSHFESLIQTALQKYSWTCERALVNFLRICITHMESHPQLQKSLVNVLDFFSHLEGEILQHFAGRLAAGLFILCNSHSGPVLASSEAWPLLIKILDRLVAIEKASETGFEILCFLVQQLPQISNLELKMYEELLELIIAYLRRVDMPNIRIKGGLHLIKSLHDSIQTKLPAEQLVNFWKKILGKIGRLCQESNSTLRIKSYSLLQEIILSQTSKDEFQQWLHWKETFEKLLIPLIIDPFKISSDMLKNISKEKSDMLRGEYEHSRQQCVALTCRTLLVILHMFNKKDEFYTLLFRVIGLLAQTIKSKDGAEIHEGNYEQLKNLLFVLKAEEVLTNEQWEQAWQVLGIPELKDEIEPKAVEEDKV